MSVPSLVLIGREREVAAGQEILLREDTRLLTVAGPGGVGKTRIGIEVAREVAGRFADGMRLIPLSSVRDPYLVLPAIAEALGLKESRGRTLETLKAHLRDKSLLLFLDNFEQVVEAGPLLSELLAELPGLKFLVTSREVLRLHGEREFMVPPLRVPDLDALPPDARDLLDYPAIELFVDRARWVEPGFRLDDSNAREVAEICARLDGLPLAIELAAARLKILSPRGILLRLKRHGLGLLAGGSRDLPERQKTIRDTMRWSHDLLDEDEQRLFRRLSAFVRGCSPEAVEAVYAGMDDPSSIAGVLDGLASLADKSLLRRSVLKSGAIRLGMLETVREYALGRLEASGEEEKVRGAHAAYYLSLVEEMARRIPAGWLETLEIEHENLRAALGWMVERGHSEDALRLAGSLWRFWSLRGHLEEGYVWLEKVLIHRDGVSATARTRALEGAGVLAHSLGDYRRAAKLGEERLALLRELGNERAVAAALDSLGHISRDSGDPVGAGSLYEEGLALKRGLEDDQGIADSLNNLGYAARDRKDLVQARSYFEEALTVLRSLGTERSVPGSPDSLGEPTPEQGDPERTARAREGCIASSLRGLGEIARLQDDHERAARLWGAAEAVREKIGVPLAGVEQAPSERAVAAARSALGEEEFATAWAEGRTMTPNEAAAFEDRTPEGPAWCADLTAREQEVLRLVTAGLTDAQVARELFISTRTVNAHLRSVYSKLGVNSRSVAIRLAREHDLV